MKFLLEYVTCCTYSSSALEASSSSPADDSRSLVPVLQPENRDRRKWRMSASKSGSEADWQPSLNSISEDNVVAVGRRNRATTGSGRSVKQTVSPAPKSHVRNRRSDDYGAPIPGIIPAFSPTPFLFCSELLKL